MVDSQNRSFTYISLKGTVTKTTCLILRNKESRSESVDGGLKLLELDPPDPWATDPRPAEELQPGEITVVHTVYIYL